LTLSLLISKGAANLRGVAVLINDLVRNPVHLAVAYAGRPNLSQPHHA